MKVQYIYLTDDLFNSCEVNIVLLNDRGVQRIEVHDQNVFVPQTTFRFENQTTFVLVFLVFAGDCNGSIPLFHLSLHYGGGLLPKGLVRRNILQSVEFVQQNIFVSLSTTSIQSFIPEGKSFHFREQVMT